MEYQVFGHRYRFDTKPFFSIQYPLFWALGRFGLVYFRLGFGKHFVNVECRRTFLVPLYLQEHVDPPNVEEGKSHLTVRSSISGGTVSIRELLAGC